MNYQLACFICICQRFLALPLNLAAMSNLRSRVLSQEVLHLPGVFLNCFLKETSQEDRRNKNWTMQRLLHRTFRLRHSPTGEQIQNGRTADEIIREPISSMWTTTVLSMFLTDFLLRNICFLVYVLVLHFLEGIHLASRWIH